jgi:Mn-dependent DtxR family transcriptional regulator
MMSGQTMCKEYTGDKKRVCDFLKRKKVARTSEIVFALKMHPKKVWEIANELEADGTIKTML